MLRICCILILLSTCLACNRKPVQEQTNFAPYEQINTPYVDSILATLTLDQKLGQLIHWQPKAINTLDKVQIQQVFQSVPLGGYTFNDLTFNTYLQLTNRLDSFNRIPYFKGTDQIVSLNNQFTDLVHYPSPITIGATGMDSLRSILQQRFTEQCELLGINFVQNPIISYRGNQSGQDWSYHFDDDPEQILHQSVQVLDRVQEGHRIAVAGSFNLSPKILTDTSQVADSLLQRYFNLSYSGLSALTIDANVLAGVKNETLPVHYLKNGLKSRIGFNGLIVSQKTNSVSIKDLLLAGTDLLITDQMPSSVFDTLKQLYHEGTLTEYTLNDRLRKILKAKYWTNVDRPSINQDFGAEEMARLFFDPSGENLVRQINEASITLVSNPDTLLPFTDLYNKHFHIFEIGKDWSRTFTRFFKKYDNYKTTWIDPNDSLVLPKLDNSFFKQKQIVLLLNDIQLETFKDSLAISTLKRWAGMTDLTVVNIGDPANLAVFPTTTTMLQLYEPGNLSESLAAQTLFGGVPTQGQLPVFVAQHLVNKKALTTLVTRLKYTIPEEVGIASYKLAAIDAIFKSAISKGCTPGGQVMVIKDGKVVYDKNFGHHTYKKKRRVEENDVYDVASLTKIMGTTMAAMDLYQKDRFSLNDQLVKYIPEIEKSRLKKTTLKQLFTHTSGLQPNMPIAPYIMARDSVEEEWAPLFARKSNKDFNIPVAKSMYFNKSQLDSVWQNVFNLEPRKSRRYRYSDVNFNLIQHIIEKRANQRLDRYLNRNFYRPLNLRYTAYNPIKKFKKEDIVPTTMDDRWRRQLVHGYVHDESAALMGGVGGNAGLFTNAQDLAVLGQLLLNGGSYGGERFLDADVIERFTKKQSGTHRGLGFDKPSKKYGRAFSAKAPASTYGHTGFTGPCIWIDPDNDLVYIFIANRINPEVRNKRLYKEKVRSRIHTVIYKALNTYPKDEEKEIDVLSYNN